MCNRWKYVSTLGFLTSLSSALMWHASAWDEAPSTTPRSEIQALADEGEFSKEKNVETFDYVWNTVHERYWDPNMGGVDWELAKTELRPKAAEAQSASELDAVLNQLLGRFEQSHFGILAKEAYDAIPGSGKSEQPATALPSSGTVGVEMRWVEEKPMVWKVADDSSAAQQGVKPGWILIEAKGKSLQEIADKVRAKHGESGHQKVILNTLVNDVVRGGIGEKGLFVWLDGSDARVETELAFGKPQGQESHFGNMPTTWVHCESKTIDEDVLYFSISIFFEPQYILEQLESLLRSRPDAKGLIIDLRGNPGGLGFLAMSIGGFVTKSDGIPLGTMQTRQGSLQFTLTPRKVAVPERVVVLVDEFSMSTSEILAAGLQDNQLAHVIGRKTPGMALPSALERLPHGAGFQYAFANYVSAKGQTLEGHGVIPDEVIALQRESLLKGQDVDIDAAVRWIRQDASAD